MRVKFAPFGHQTALDEISRFYLCPTIHSAHTLLTIIYYVLKRHEPYRELGGNYFEERDRQAIEQRLVGRLRKLGFDVTLQPLTQPS